jgi:hypothetical protein
LAPFDVRFDEPFCQDRLGTSIGRVERENGVFWSVKDGNSRLSFGIQWRTILREVGDALGGEDMSGVKTRRVFAVAGQFPAEKRSSFAKTDLGPNIYIRIMGETS